MTKALACYDGDASRLLDVCRARIVFETLQDLVACLRLLALPSSCAKIRRIRNSMRPGFEDALIGFRVKMPVPSTTPRPHTHLYNCKHMHSVNQ